MATAIKQGTDWSLDRLQTRLIFDKYDPLFNFFFSKPIADICQGAESTQEKLFRELAYYDSDNEFLKRFYNINEVPERIELLYEIHHPEQLWKTETPTVTSDLGRGYICKHLKRQKKHARKLAELKEEELEEYSSRFLSSAHNESSAESQQNNPVAKSYDSSLHDIYSEYTQPPMDQIVTDMSKCFTFRSLGDHPEQWGFADGPEHLTMDFDDLDEENILADYTRFKNKFKRRRSKNKDQNTQYTRPRSPEQYGNYYNKSSYIPPQAPTINPRIGPTFSPTRRAEKIAAIRALKKQIEISTQEMPMPVSPGRMNERYGSPRLNQLSNYSKKVFGHSGISSNMSSGLTMTGNKHSYPIDGSIEMHNSHHFDKGLASVKSFESKGFSNLMHGARPQYERNSHRINEFTHNQPAVHTNSYRSPEFDQIRRKAIELIQNDKHYGTEARMRSPRYEQFKRNPNFNNY